ncbi:alpha/beta hydrolase [Pseudoduganella armeniaca]|uniref:Alpha/beta hydrolase n=2 Tax=Pseudoduganella armeniaca TaxID=2072590 RepID=A0A2R4CBR4_9BURK|nr:alpha/beta hydrolase [Pseudoduganella armeniaca]
MEQRTGTMPSTAVLLFPGYPGVLRLREEGGQPRYELAGNFLVRARRHLADEDIFTVMVDCPLDRWSSCNDAYRTSATHAADVSDVIGLVKREFGARQVYVAGTSYGTLSSAMLARALGGTIDGAIHTATFTDPGADGHGAALRDFDWSEARVPQLFVHHKEDPCALTRYAGIAARRGELPLISVTGAAGVRGQACEAFTQHGFVGRERVVMRAIADWVKDRRVTSPVGVECPAAGALSSCRSDQAAE